MRLWSLDPKYLDRAGLLALWREGLLAKKVLEGNTKGYKNHPQLIRFKNYKTPLLAINSFLYFVYLESKNRLYNFDKTKIKLHGQKKIIFVNLEQIEFEVKHLLKKLKLRDKKKYLELKKIKLTQIKINPIFKKINGEIESWEKGVL